MISKSTLAITLLSLSALALLVANWIAPAPAAAQVVVAQDDYVAGTAGTQTGNDALYIVDNRSGQVAVFTYDPGSRSVRF
jgi:hypothetical protein